MCNQPQAEKPETPPHCKREEDIVMTPDLEHSPESKLPPEPVPEEVMSRSSDPPSPKND